MMWVHVNVRHPGYSNDHGYTVIFHKPLAANWRNWCFLNSSHVDYFFLILLRQFQSIIVAISQGIIKCQHESWWSMCVHIYITERLLYWRTLWKVCGVSTAFARINISASKRFRCPGIPKRTVLLLRSKAVSRSKRSFFLVVLISSETTVCMQMLLIYVRATFIQLYLLNAYILAQFS